jgi:glucose-1-phosphate thymidylyltransferase
VEIARALILATPDPDDRPWSSVGPRPKPLVPVATRPILFHALDALRAAGVLEVTLVTEPVTASLFQAAVGDGERWEMAIRYAESGIGTSVREALRVANGFVGDEPVLVQWADALLEQRLRGHLAGFAREDVDALALRIRNAPAQEPRALPTGCYLFNPDAVHRLVQGKPAEDPIAALRDHGARVRVLDVDGCLACHGTEEALLRGNRLALERLRTDVTGATLVESEIQGPVVIHPTATLKRTLVRGPAIIGAGACLVDSYVGSYTSIGAGAQLEGTEIEHSIVMDDARLLFVGSRLETSIIGRGATILRRFAMPSAVRVSVGDGAEVALS